MQENQFSFFSAAKAVFDIVKKTPKERWMYYVTVGSVFALIFGNMSHVSISFSSIEAPEYWWVGYVLGFGVSITMFAIGVGITVQAQHGISNRSLWWYIAFFGFIEVYANINYSLEVVSEGQKWAEELLRSPEYSVVKIGLLSFTIPFLVLALIQLQAAFYTTWMTIDAKEAAKEKRKQTLEAKKSESVSGIPQQPIDADVILQQHLSDELALFTTPPIRPKVLAKKSMKKRGRPEKVYGVVRRDLDAN
jgi:hypothetical protein